MVTSTSGIRELSDAEIDTVAAGDGTTITIGPAKITGGDGIFGFGITGVGGVWINTNTGTVGASLGSAQVML